MRMATTENMEARKTIMSKWVWGRPSFILAGKEYRRFAGEDGWHAQATFYRYVMNWEYSSRRAEREREKEERW